MMVEGPNAEGSTWSRSLEVNGDVDSRSSDSTLDQSSSTICSYGDARRLGLTGLFNLGNTCFMNSAIQCLAHTGKLVNFFLEDFRKDINVDNRLGSKGKLATAFGDLIRKRWAPGASPISPTLFKLVISKFAPQFSGHNQHDSQEFLAFLLDGLHEDLKRVESKPYTKSTDDDTRTDEILAEEHWQNHLGRNSSIIVDLCQGQYRSTIVCPDCQKKSVTFDPFMYLTLPIPSTTTRTMTLTIVSSHGAFRPYQVTIRVPQHETYADLLQALLSECELRNDETLIMVEIHGNSILRVLDSHSESIELIRDVDRLVAYRMSKEEVAYPLFEFIHCEEKPDMLPQKFGFPLLGRISDFSQGSELRKLFLKLMSPISPPLEESSYNIFWDDEHTRKEEAKMVELSVCSDDENNLPEDSDFHFVLDYRYNGKYDPIQMDEPVPAVPADCKMAKFYVYWSPEMINNYDTELLRHIPEVYRVKIPLRRIEAITLDKCLHEFLKEEPLGPDDMWFCSNCKEGKQASKKLDIWRLPDILVIHLKRFSHNKDSKNKLKDFVDFPINDFDLSSFLAQKCDTFSHHYSLYAVSNHFGEMGVGHYTAFAQLKHKKWYKFDDEMVSAVNEEQIATSAAYVLLYKRI